jgi:hypothetical protein
MWKKVSASVGIGVGKKDEEILKDIECDAKGIYIMCMHKEVLKRREGEVEKDTSIEFDESDL